MTITLAAVYAPIGFQGGLTGALFREFAFTLAGAVFISGVVALTLSPMMSSRLLRPSTSTAGSRARSSAAFDARQERATRAMLAATLRFRPAVYAVWIVLSLLLMPHVHVLAEELAPHEDQGVVFGAIDVPANATLEQVTPYTDAGRHDLRRRRPSSSTASRSRFPTGGFGGMLAEAVDRAQAQRLPDPARAEHASWRGITGIRAPVFLPPALPNPGLFPVEFVIVVDGGARGAGALRRAAGAWRR